MEFSQKVSGRALKKRVYEVLHTKDLKQAEEELCSLPPLQVINPLFGMFCNADPKIRWAAVRVAAAVVATLADRDMEGARNIVRRMMWNLNDESGGIGWGLPEAMGETLARHEILAREYARILISYSMEKANYLEHEGLQRGLLWGIGRVARVRPLLVKEGVPHFMKYLDSTDASVRGHSAWVMGLLDVRQALPRLEALTKDDSEFEIYLNGHLETRRVRDMAVWALEKIKA